MEMLKSGREQSKLAGLAAVKKNGQPHRAASAAPSSSERGCEAHEPIETSMVGRETEMGLLESALRAVSETQKLRMVTVLGEAGIGKSRLRQEFLGRVEVLPSQPLIFFCAANAEMSSRPFSLIREMFRQRFNILDSDPAKAARAKFERGFAEIFGGENGTEVGLSGGRLAEILGFGFSDGRASGTGQAPVETRYEFFEGISRLFASLNPPAGQHAAKAGQQGAALLVVEDAHWADDASLDLLEHLVRHCEARPILVLALARPALLERRPAWGVKNHARLELKALSPRECELLVQRTLGTELYASAAVCEPVAAAAGGNPFYIEETLNVLMENQLVVGGGGQWRLDPKRFAEAAIPLTVDGIVRRRLEGLSKLERELLGAAAVVGRVFWDSALERLLGDGASLKEVLAGLCAKDLIHRRPNSTFAGSAEFAFKHELLRDACSPFGMAQSRYHAEMAAWLIEQSGWRIEEMAGLVAVHYEQAGKGTEAAEWYGRAGQHAQTAYAPASAIEYFEKALALEGGQDHPAGRDRLRLEWLSGLGESLTKQGRFSEAHTSYGELQRRAEEHGDIAAQTKAWNGMAYLRERLGNNRASLEAARKAEELARRAGESCRGELLRALHLQGWAFYRLSDAPQVLALAQQTLDLCKQSGDRARMAVSFKLFGVAYLQLGRYPEADVNFEQGLALCQQLGDQRETSAMFSNLGESARLRGEFQRAADLYQKALAIARGIGERSSEMVYLNNLAGARLGLRQFAQAECELREAIALTGVPNSCVLAETFSFLAAACLGQGRRTEALAAAERAVVVAQESGNVWDLAGSWRALGEVLGDLVRAGETIPARLRSTDECFAESLRLYETIGAQDEAARTRQARTKATKGKDER
jgi:tetratricopeptide (TPR) repeat protein